MGGIRLNEDCKKTRNPFFLLAEKRLMAGTSEGKKKKWGEGKKRKGKRRNERRERFLCRSKMAIPWRWGGCRRGNPERVGSFGKVEGVLISFEGACPAVEKKTRYLKRSAKSPKNSEQRGRPRQKRVPHFVGEIGGVFFPRSVARQKKGPTGKGILSHTEYALHQAGNPTLGLSGKRVFRDGVVRRKKVPPLEGPSARG